MELGSGWLKALEVRGATAFLAFAAAALISLGHERAWFSLAALPVWAASVANIAAILFGVLSLPWLLNGITIPFRRAASARERSREIDQQLRTLTQEEAEVLCSMIVERRRVVVAGHRTVGEWGLYNRGLLQAQARVNNQSVLWMPDEIWKRFEGDEEEALKMLRQIEERKRRQRFE